MTLFEYIEMLQKLANKHLYPDKDTPPMMLKVGDKIFTDGHKEVLSISLAYGPKPDTTCAIELNTNTDAG